MPYGKQIKKEHAYKTIDKDIKGGKLNNLLLFYGKEQYLVNWSINSIVKRYVNESCKALDYTVFEPEKTTVQTIIESCETLSMFSERRVVVLPDFPPLLGGKLKGYTDTEEMEFLKYIKDIPESCIFILTAQNVDKRKKLYKEIEVVGSVYEFGLLDEKQLKGFIAKRFKASDKVIKTSVIDALIESTGYYHKDSDYTIYNLENDIKKMIAHSEGDEVILSDVLVAVAGDLEMNIFAMLDAVSRGRKDEAYRLLYNLLGSGENVYMVLSLIASQFELILEVKELKDEGCDHAQIKNELGVHEFRIKKALGFAGRYSTDNLKRILQKLYSVDVSIKTGLLEQNLALELLIAEI